MRSKKNGLPCASAYWGLTRILQSSPQVSETWFVLVVDDCARQVLRHLLGARDMMVRNVALIIGIEDQRQPIPTACAVYFCSPTQKNFGLFMGTSRQDTMQATNSLPAPGPRSYINLHSLSSGQMWQQENWLHALLSILCLFA